MQHQPAAAGNYKVGVETLDITTQKSHFLSAVVNTKDAAKHANGLCF
jgi:hypothetical protein